MSVQRHRGTIIFECDYCGDQHVTGTDEWDDAIADLKDNDWFFTKEDGQWKHYCKNCRD